MSPRRRGVTLGWFAVAAVVLAAVLASGSVTFVTTTGTSMLPRFHSGDLAVLRAVADYQVGDVAAYRSAALDATVMHRIVATDGTTFTFRGDHNDWLDPETPTAEDLIGRLVLRIPQGGTWLRRASGPPMVGLIVLVLLVSGGAAARTRHDHRSAPVTTRSRRDAASTRSARSAPSRFDAGALGAGALACVVLAGVLGAVALPRSVHAPASETFEQQASFGYRALAADSTVYPDGQVVTGDVVFREVVDEIDVTVDWELTPPSGRDAPEDVHGSASLVAELADGTGWRRRVTLGEIEITGPAATLEGAVDLRRLERLAASIEAATGTTSSSQSLTLVADVEFTGELAGRRVTERFTPELRFTLDGTRMQPPAGEESGSPFVVSQAVSVEVPDAVPATVGFAGRTATVLVVRRAAGLLLAFGCLLAVGAGARWWRERTMSESGLIAARYGHLLVEASEPTPVDGRLQVELATIDGLAVVAERLGTAIVMAPLLDGGRVYAVEEPQTRYRYRSLAA